MVDPFLQLPMSRSMNIIAELFPLLLRTTALSFPTAAQVCRQASSRHFSQQTLCQADSLPEAASNCLIFK